MSIIHHVWSYFQKPMVRICLDYHIRTIVVLTGGKLIGFYFLYLLYATYYSVTTHLRQGKKVSIICWVMYVRNIVLFCRYTNHDYVRLSH
jgi:uncharacterized membrane protein (GlpM family)